MKTQRGYLPQDSIYPLHGLNTFDPSTQIDPSQSPNCLNMELIKGQTAKRQGYSLLGSGLTDLIIGVVEFQSFSGVRTLLAFTTKKQYKFDTGSSSWVNITYQSGASDVNWTGDETNTLDWAIVSGNDESIPQILTFTPSTPTSGDVVTMTYTAFDGTVTNQTATLTASTAANFVSVCKTAWNGNSTLSAVATASGSSTLILTDVVGGEASSITLSVSGTGTVSSSTTQAAGGNYTSWIIITNGKDQPRYWDGSMSKFGLYSPVGITGFVTFGAVASFNDHLILANVNDGAAHPTTLYWSEIQSLTKFQDVTQDTGSAIIPDVEGEIQRMLQLGDRIMIYSDNAIHAMTYIAGTSIFTFQKILQETRLVNKRSIVNIGPFHLFLSQENVIYFDGTPLWGQIGNSIYRSYRDEFDSSNKFMSFAYHDVAKLHVYFFYPTSSSTSQAYKVEYTLQNIMGSSWTKLKYVDRATSMGQFSRDSNLTWDSPYLVDVRWAGITLTWTQGSIKGSFPVRVFGSDGGDVFLSDDTVPNDNGVAPDAYWDTMDFTSEQAYLLAYRIPQPYQSEFMRIIEVEMDLKGFEVDVLYSIDQGQTYVPIMTLNLSNSWNWYRIPIDVMTRTFRIRLRNTCPSSTFSFRDIRMWFKPGGPSVG